MAGREEEDYPGKKGFPLAVRRGLVILYVFGMSSIFQETQRLTRRCWDRELGGKVTVKRSSCHIE
jgi:hypothetical protein